MRSLDRGVVVGDGSIAELTTTLNNVNSEMHGDGVPRNETMSWVVHTGRDPTVFVTPLVEYDSRTL